MNQLPGSVADAAAASSEARRPTPAEWFGIALVALLFAWTSVLGLFALHYFLIAFESNYAAQVAQGLGPLDSYMFYGIPKLVPLVASVLVVLRHRWAVVTGCAWVGWVFLWEIVGAIRFGLAGLHSFSPESPVSSVITLLLLYGAFISCAFYLVALRRRGVLR